MILSLLSGGSFLSTLLSLILILPVMALALSLHETAHGFVAWKLGDPTAHNLGRLTLNPLRHLDPIGFLCLLVFGFGWAKPVPINTRYFRNSRRDMALTALAGPGANLLLGLISAVLYGVFAGLIHVFGDPASGFLLTVLSWSSTFCYFGAFVNFLYMTFNLIPIPPFDGSRFAFLFLPEKLYFGIMKYERQIMYGLLIALLLCSYLFSFSPFAFVAENLTSLIANAVYRLFL